MHQPTPSDPNLNVSWDTSKDKSGHYLDGPGPGSDSNPSHAPANGYNNNSPSATPLNAPPGDDYTAWNWEQVLNGVLGMQLPERFSVSNLNWTATDSKDEGGSLFQIFGFPGDFTVPASAYGGGLYINPFYVYLNPAVQNPGGPWD